MFQLKMHIYPYISYNKIYILNDITNHHRTAFVSGPTRIFKSKKPYTFYFLIIFYFYLLLHHNIHSW